VPEKRVALDVVIVCQTHELGLLSIGKTLTTSWEATMVATARARTLEKCMIAVKGGCEEACKVLMEKFAS
jgi:hypothetical protein